MQRAHAGPAARHEYDGAGRVGGPQIGQDRRLPPHHQLRGRVRPRQVAGVGLVQDLVAHHAGRGAVPGRHHRSELAVQRRAAAVAEEGPLGPVEAGRRDGIAAAVVEPAGDAVRPRAGSDRREVGRPAVLVEVEQHADVPGVTEPHQRVQLGEPRLVPVVHAAGRGERLVVAPWRRDADEVRAEDGGLLVDRGVERMHVDPAQHHRRAGAVDEAGAAGGHVRAGVGRGRARRRRGAPGRRHAARGQEQQRPDQDEAGRTAHHCRLHAVAGSQ